MPVGLMNGSKRARNTPSLANQTTIYGIMGGLSPRVGTSNVSVYRHMLIKAGRGLPELYGMSFNEQQQYLKDNNLLSVNPQCSGGVGKRNLIMHCRSSSSPEHKDEHEHEHEHGHLPEPPALAPVPSTDYYNKIIKMGEFIPSSGTDPDTGYSYNQNPNVTAGGKLIPHAIFLFNNKSDADNNIEPNNTIETYGTNPTQYFIKDTTKLKGWPEDESALTLPAPAPEPEPDFTYVISNGDVKTIQTLSTSASTSSYSLSNVNGKEPQYGTVTLQHDGINGKYYVKYTHTDTNNTSEQKDAFSYDIKSWSGYGNPTTRYSALITILESEPAPVTPTTVTLNSGNSLGDYYTQEISGLTNVDQISIESLEGTGSKWETEGSPEVKFTEYYEGTRSLKKKGLSTFYFNKKQSLGTRDLNTKSFLGYATYSKKVGYSGFGGTTLHYAFFLKIDFVLNLGFLAVNSKGFWHITPNVLSSDSDAVNYFNSNKDQIQGSDIMTGTEFSIKNVTLKIAPSSSSTGGGGIEHHETGGDPSNEGGFGGGGDHHVIGGGGGIEHHETGGGLGENISGGSGSGGSGSGGSGSGGSGGGEAPAPITDKSYVFEGTGELTRTIVKNANLPETVTTIIIKGYSSIGDTSDVGNGAFNDFTSFSSVTIPASVTSIGNMAFWSCGNLTEVIFEKNSNLKTIGYQAFWSTEALTSITLPASLTSISNGSPTNNTYPAFTSSGLKTVYLPYPNGMSIPPQNNVIFYGATGVNIIDPAPLTALERAAEAGKVSVPPSNYKLPVVDIYVSPGQAMGQDLKVYTFYTDKDGTNVLKGTKLYTYIDYRFHRLNNTTSNAFYISDDDRNKKSTKVTLTGSGSATSGITNSQTFELNFNLFDITRDHLWYYSTSSGDMFKNLFTVSQELSSYGIQLSTEEAIALSSAPATALQIAAAAGRVPIPPNYGTAPPIVDIYVDAGSLTKPFYNFYTDASAQFKLKDTTLYTYLNYRFHRLNNATSHPFYISDVGYKQKSSKIKLDGSGSAVSGIINSQTFELNFNLFNIESDKLYYYCTSHSNMIDSFTISQQLSTYGLQIQSGRATEFSSELINDGNSAPEGSTVFNLTNNTSIHTNISGMLTGNVAQKIHNENGVDITSIIIGSNVTGIQQGALGPIYQGALNNLNSVVIGENVKTIATGGLANGYLKKVTFAKNSNLTSIGYQAFYQTAITSIVIPPKVTNIGKLAFGGSSLTSITISGEDVTMADDVFMYGADIKTVFISDNLKINGKTVSTGVNQNFFGKTGVTISSPASIAAAAEKEKEEKEEEKEEEEKKEEEAAAAANSTTITGFARQRNGWNVPAVTLSALSKEINITTINILGGIVDGGGISSNEKGKNWNWTSLMDVSGQEIAANTGQTSWLGYIYNETYTKFVGVQFSADQNKVYIVGMNTGHYPGDALSEFGLMMMKTIFNRGGYGPGLAPVYYPKFKVDTNPINGGVATSETDDGYGVKDMVISIEYTN